MPHHDTDSPHAHGSHAHGPHAHGHSLADDLPLLEAQVARRRALKWFAGAGTAALVAGCGGSGSAINVRPIACGDGTAFSQPALCVDAAQSQLALAASMTLTDTLVPAKALVSTLSMDAALPTSKPAALVAEENFSRAIVMAAD